MAVFGVDGAGCEARAEHIFQGTSHGRCGFASPYDEDSRITLQREGAVVYAESAICDLHGTAHALTRISCRDSSPEYVVGVG